MELKPVGAVVMNPMAPKKHCCTYTVFGRCELLSETDSNPSQCFQTAEACQEACVPLLNSFFTDYNDWEIDPPADHFAILPSIEQMKLVRNEFKLVLDRVLYLRDRLYQTRYLVDFRTWEDLDHSLAWGTPQFFTEEMRGSMLRQWTRADVDFQMNYRNALRKLNELA